MPPSAVSAAGLLFTGIAVVLMYRWFISASPGWLRAAGAVILFAASWDTVDGELARATGKTSAKGAILDAVFDRVSEFIIFLGLVLFMGFSKLDCTLLFALLFASYSISYIRARAEGVGIECTIGIFDRATRVIIIGAGLILLPRYMNWVMRLLLVGTSVTAVRRFVYVLSRRKKD
jgi:CDP-diacylglycerol--glycerol-3-phosphate 3-phosphatidyltransferase